MVDCQSTESSGLEDFNEQVWQVFSERGQANLRDPKAPGRVSVEALIAAGSRRSPRWWQSTRAVSRRGIARSQLEDVPPRPSVMGVAPLEWRLKLPGELRRWRSGTREHDAVRG